MTVATLLASLATSLASQSPERLVISVERDGSVSFSTPGVSMRVSLDASRVEGRVDEPDTLHALRDVAAKHPRVKVILQLPPEHVGWR